MPRRNLRILLFALLLCAMCAPRVSRSARILWYSMGQIHSRYLVPVDESQLFEGAMTGMTAALDDYSTYVPASVLEQFNEQIDREFGGLGIEIRVDPETKYLTIASPLVGTPAHEAGLLAGDRILRIDDQSTQGLSIEDAAERLRGAEDEPVTLTILSKGQEKPRDVDLVRAIVHIDTVLGDTRQPDGTWNYRLEAHPHIAYLRIDSFGDQTGEEMRRVVAQQIDTGAAGLILDVRDNPGGLLPAAIDICDLFVDPNCPPPPVSIQTPVVPGLIVTTRNRHGHILREYFAHSDGTINSLPMVVLVNGESASASEIVAGCLQDHQKAIIVGERSFGKGTVQELLDLHPDQGLLKLTTASYWRPSGRDINRRDDVDQWGVSPNEGCQVPLEEQERTDWRIARRMRDVAQSYTEQELENEDVPDFNDRQLDTAIQILQEQIDNQ